MGLPLRLFMGPPPSQDPPIRASLVGIIPRTSIHRMDEETDLGEPSQRLHQYPFGKLTGQVGGARGKVTVYLTGEEDEDSREEGADLYAKALVVGYDV